MSEGLLISTSDTPITSPLSSVKSSLSLPSSRSLSPVSSNPSAVNSPQVGSTTIQNRSESVGINNQYTEEGLVERGGVERDESQSSNFSGDRSNSNSGDRESGTGISTTSRSSEESGESNTTSPEQHVTRSLEKLTLKTKAEFINSDAPRVKSVSLTLPPVASGAHSRTSPLYSPSTTTATYPYYFVQKDGQVFNVEIPVEQASPASILSTSSLSPQTAYFPAGTWTGALSPTSLHPALRPFSQQPTPRGEYVASPSGLYTESNFQQQQQHQYLMQPALNSMNPHHHSHPSSSHQPQHRLALTPPQPSPRSLAKQRRSSSKKSASTSLESNKIALLDDEVGSSGTSSPRSGTKSGSSSINSSPQKEEGGRERSKRKSKGRGAVDKEGKIDNKHTLPPGKEVFREMFYTSEQPSTVVATATPVGMIIPQTTTISSPTGEVHVSTMFSSPPQPKITPTPVPYPSGYPYTHVYYDPVTQAYYQALPYVPSSQMPSQSSSTGSPGQPTQPASGGSSGGPQQPLGQGGGGVATLIGTPTGGATPVGIIQDPASRAVYQFPIAGSPAQWGGGEPTYYMPRPPRGPRVRPGVCLFVFHIPPSVTDEELYALFSTCGRVLSAKVMRNAHTAESKGFGFVNMANQRDVEVAIGTLHGYYWKNKYLKVSYKKKRYHGRNQ